MQCVKQVFMRWPTIKLNIIHSQIGCNTLSTNRNHWLHKGPVCKGKNFFVFFACLLHYPWLKTTIPYISPSFLQAPYSSTLKIRAEGSSELHSITSHKTTILRHTKICDSNHNKLIMFNKKYLVREQYAIKKVSSCNTHSATCMSLHTATCAKDNIILTTISKQVLVRRQILYEHYTI